MTGLDPGAFARLLCGYCIEAQPGEQVIVRSTTLASPLLLALQRELLERECWPLLRPALPGADEGFYAHARDLHLDGFAPVDLLEAEHVDARIVIQAPDNTRALAGVDPSLLARAAAARRPVKDASMRMRWALSVWPTPALAQNAGMGLGEFTAFVRAALFLDQDDPVAAWGALRERQAKLIARLSSASEIRIEAEGTDLTLNVAGRTWINSDGRRNMPSGEVFTGPHEDSASGVITYTIPSAPGGVDVAGVRLRFEEGRVVEATADRGQEYLRSVLATDDGASRLGELGIGTNFGIDRAVGMILLDEKIGGTVHLAVGSSYPETGGVNRSAVHWDMICDLRGGGRLLADGEPVEIPGG